MKRKSSNEYLMRIGGIMRKVSDGNGKKICK
jgi:hypothetical protein